MNSAWKEISARALQQSDTFHFEGGIRRFVKDPERGHRPRVRHIVDVGRDRGRDHRLALQFNTGYKETVHTFANNIRTTEGAPTWWASRPR
jgi:DNA gyrase subunit B